MEPTHVGHVVRIHQESFTGYPTTRYGPAFLQSLYHEYCQSTAGVSYVHLAQGAGVDGFVCGVFDYRQFYTGLVRHRALRIGLALAGAVTRTPTLATGVAKRTAAVLRLVFSRKRRSPSDIKELEWLQTRRIAYLASIAVADSARKAGAGRDLVAALVSELARRGYQHCLLDTDADNAGANKFFVRAGFRRVTSYTLFEDTRVGNIYVMDLGQETTSVR